MFVLSRRAVIVASGIVGLGFAVGTTGIAFARPVLASRFHAHLERSEPTANDTLAAAPRVLKLWFSEKIELKTSNVKLEGAAGAVALGDLMREDTKDAPVTAAVTKVLPAGSYTVRWTAGGSDGHPTKGTYSFILKGVK